MTIPHEGAEKSTPEKPKGQDAQPKPEDSEIGSMLGLHESSYGRMERRASLPLWQEMPEIIDCAQNEKVLVLIFNDK